MTQPAIQVVHTGNAAQPCAQGVRRHDWTIFAIGQVVPCCGYATQCPARVCKVCHRHEEVA